MRTASVEQDPATRRSLGPTALGRSVDAAPFRLTLLLHSACCDQAPLRLLDDAAILNLLSLKRPLVVIYALPASLPRPGDAFTTGVRRPGADATLRRIQAQAFGWINY